MPELPEVETVARGLRGGIVGRSIAAVNLCRPDVLRTDPTLFRAELPGCTVAGVRRRGKYLLIDLIPPGRIADCGGGTPEPRPTTQDDNVIARSEATKQSPLPGDCFASLAMTEYALLTGEEGRRLGEASTLLVHLGMTGQLLLLPADAPVQSHTHLCVDFVGGDLQLRYRDPRRFGFLALRPTATVEQEPPLAGLGPEPLEMSLAEFRAALGGRRGRIKALLLSQGVIAGLGNIYADEVLFAARLHPEWPAESLRPVHHRRLYEAIQRILRAAVEARGSSINNYVSVDGRPGGYQAHHQVYGRTGQPCPGCGTAIRRILAAGRSTHFCPRCQRRR